MHVFVVVIICHTTLSVIGQFLFAAQDAGMTSGDYAYFTFSALPSSDVTDPWSAYSTSEQNMTHRMAAFYAFKQA